MGTLFRQKWPLKMGTHLKCWVNLVEWVIVGWLKKKKFIILGNYYPIEPSSDLTNIGQLFLLKYWANIYQQY